MLRSVPALFLLLASPALAQTRWMVLEAQDGQKFGQSRIESAETPQGRVTLETATRVYKEAESPVQVIAERTRQLFGTDGRLLRIEQSNRSGGKVVRTIATITETEAIVTRRTGGDVHSERVLLPPGVRFDGGEPLIRNWDRKAPLSFAAFSLSLPGVEPVTLSPAPPEPDGREAILRTIRSGSELRSVTRLVLAADGSIAAAHQPMFGTVIVQRRANEAEAKARNKPFGMDHAGLIKFPWRISDEAKKGHIRYTFHFAPGFAFPLPQTGEQRTTGKGGEGVVLDICAQCGVASPLNPAERAEALRPTLWMQSNHPFLQRIAAPIRQANMTDREKMVQLGKAARRHIGKTDFVGHYSALEALRRGAGDCTEDAVALAALGRAAGIPTKVASGLVYTRDRHHGLSNVFMPHSWTLAWIDGRWQSFDISIGSFDATHLAFTVGDGDPRSLGAANALAGLLQWEKVAEIRPKPAE